MALEILIRRPVRTLPPTATCTEAAELMRSANVGAVVVAQGTEPRGIITDRDLTTRVMAERRDPATVQLREVMSSFPVFISNTRSLGDAIHTMHKFGVRRLPVVDESGQLDGLVSMDDLLMLMGRQLGELGEAIMRELAWGQTRTPETRAADSPNGR